MLYTQNGTLVLLETKGDARDNSDSAATNRLGQKWAEQTGLQHKYFMVFETHRLADTHTVAEVNVLINQL